MKVGDEQALWLCQTVRPMTAGQCVYAVGEPHVIISRPGRRRVDVFASSSGTLSPARNSTYTPETSGASPIYSVIQIFNIQYSVLQV